MPATIGTTVLGSLFRWQLSWGLADVQGAALVTLGLAGAVAWSRGTPASAVQGYLRLLAAEGGHLVVLVALAGMVAGGGAALAYVLVLSMPASHLGPGGRRRLCPLRHPAGGPHSACGLGRAGERTLPTAKQAGAAAETVPAERTTRLRHENRRSAGQREGDLRRKC